MIYALAKDTSTYYIRYIGNANGTMTQHFLLSAQARTLSLKAIYQGECDVSIINHYYWAKLNNGDIPEQKQWADAVRIVFTNQDNRGSHINISGGGVPKHANNKEGAIQFLEFLSGPEAQRLYGTVNFEYPVNPEVPASEDLQVLGAFKEDDLPITRIAELAPTAQRIVDEVGW